jgi:hypothetical protein
MDSSSFVAPDPPGKRLFQITMLTWLSLERPSLLFLDHVGQHFWLSVLLL